MLLPRESRTWRLVVAAVPVHLALSVGWAIVLAHVLPRRRYVVGGVMAGAAIAALDIGIVGRLFPGIRALPPAPQVADHIAFGAIVAAVLRRRRAAGDALA